MLGGEAWFRGLQEPVLQAIIKHKSLILVIIGTKAGKSLLFMLPARSISSRTTVVISPLVLLQDNLVNQC